MSGGHKGLGKWLREGASAVNHKLNRRDDWKLSPEARQTPVAGGVETFNRAAGRGQTPLRGNTHERGAQAAFSGSTDPIPARDVWTEVNGVATYARVMGRGSPLVIVPGLACSHASYARVQRHLAAHYEVWAYDPPGHGLTAAHPDTFLTLPALAQHLETWLSVQGLTVAPLFGHSLGGQVLLHLAARRPAGGSPLILCAPTGRSDTPPSLRQIRRLILDARHERPAFLWRTLRSYQHAGLRRAWQLLQASRQDNPLALAAAVHVPVLILQGGQDDVIRRHALRDLADALPQAQWVEVLEGGHALHDRCAAEVATETLAFLGRNRSPS